MTLGPIRIVVSIDVDAGNDPVDAYRRLHGALGALPTGIYWESSDEWYDARGNPLPLEQVEAARMAVIKEVMG